MYELTYEKYELISDRSQSNHRIFASIWRKEEHLDNYFRLVGYNVLTPSVTGLLTLNVDARHQISVEKGDFLGFHYSGRDVHKFNDPGSLASTTFGRGTVSGTSLKGGIIISLCIITIILEDKRMKLTGSYVDNNNNNNNNEKLVLRHKRQRCYLSSARLSATSQHTSQQRTPLSNLSARLSATHASQQP